MNDPYKVLGVSPNATEEEIKAAYRTLARKYQQDNYEGSPLSKIAEQKMKELDEAYDTVIAICRSSGNQQKNSESGNYQYEYNGGEEYRDIRMKISAGRIDDAEMILDGVPQAQRHAEWHFLKGTIQYKRGWFEEAYNRFSLACQMEPSNREYRAALNQLLNQRSGGYRTTTGPAGCTACDCCSSLICADCCCECMGGNGCC